MANVRTNVAELKVRRKKCERVFSPRTESGRGINIPNGWCLCHKLVTQSKAKTFAFPQGLEGFRNGTPRSRHPFFRVCGGPPIFMMPRARRQHRRQVIVR